MNEQPTESPESRAKTVEMSPELIAALLEAMQENRAEENQP